MSKRFIECDMDALLENQYCKATQDKDRGSMKLLKEFLEHNNLSFHNLSNQQLDKQLGKFYAFLKTKNGESMKKNTLNGIRHGLNRQMKRMEGKKEDFDIVHHPDFASSTNIFKAVMKKLKIEGKGDVKHYSP